MTTRALIAIGILLIAMVIGPALIQGVGKITVKVMVAAGEKPELVAAQRRDTDRLACCFGRACLGLVAICVTTVCMAQIRSVLALLLHLWEASVTRQSRRAAVP